VRDGGEALHVGADDPGDDLGLGVAQLGKLGSHVGHRTVVLAQLPAGRDRGRVGSASASASARAIGSSPAWQTAARRRSSSGPTCSAANRLIASGPPYSAIQCRAALAMPS
jgi:hypothetical protein